MTFHRMPAAAGLIELKDAEGDPADVVTKALEDLTKSVDDRFKALEAKGMPKGEEKPAETPEVKALGGRLDKLEARLNRPGAGGAQEAPEVSAERKSFGVYLRRGDAGLGEVERKALTVGTDASAGFLAPETYGDEILKKLVEFSPIRAFAKVVRIAGPEVRYPRRVTGTNAAWVSEIANRTESTPTYEQVTIAPGELATYVDISKQLLEDSAYDVERELRDMLAEDFGAKEATAFVSGNGTNKPVGLLSATGLVEVVSGAASTLGSAPGDTLIGLFSALPTAYAQNAAWVMNRNTLATIRKVKDTTGAYVWQPGLQAGQPSTLLGRPVVESVDMPDIAAGAYPIIFGDLSAYRVVDKVGLSVLVDPFSRATNGITRFHARMRVGGDVTNPDRIAKLKIAAS